MVYLFTIYYVPYHANSSIVNSIICYVDTIEHYIVHIYVDILVLLGMPINLLKIVALIFISIISICDIFGTMLRTQPGLEQDLHHVLAPYRYRLVVYDLNVGVQRDHVVTFVVLFTTNGNWYNLQNYRKTIY